MSGPILTLPKEVHAALWAHLMDQSPFEEAAFSYMREDSLKEADAYQYIEWYPVPPSGFTSRSGFHLELTDDTRALVIKRAHDLGASLVEFHSHTGHWPPAFSPSDLAGFREFVPHVWWRLKRRPYLAVVVGHSGFDGLAWVTDAHRPARLGGIRVNGELLMPTGLSSLSMEPNDDE